ncbi:hypothetical protein Droror1_Dr00008761 [Drosera rotundifolia]
MALTFPQLSFPPLASNNYDQWSIQMKIFLKDQEVWDVIKVGYDVMLAAAVTMKAQREARVRDKKALSFLHQGTDDANFDKIIEVRNAKIAWEILRDSFKRVDNGVHDLDRKHSKKEKKRKIKEEVDEDFQRIEGTKGKKHHVNKIENMKAKVKTKGGEVDLNTKEIEASGLDDSVEQESLDVHIDDLKQMLKSTSEKYETMLDEEKHEIEHMTSLMNQNKVEYGKHIEEFGLALRTTNEKYEGMLDEAKNEINHLTDTVQQTISKADWEQRESQLVRCLKDSDEEKSHLKEASEKYAAMLDDAKQEINDLKDAMQHIEEEHALSKVEWEEKELQLMNYLKSTEEEVFSLNQEVVRLRASLKEVEVQESSMSHVVEVRLLKDPVTGKNRGFAFVRINTKEQACRALAEMMSPMLGENQQVMEITLSKAHDDPDVFERIENGGTDVLTKDLELSPEVVEN